MDFLFLKSHHCICLTSIPYKDNHHRKYRRLLIWEIIVPVRRIFATFRMQSTF